MVDGVAFGQKNGGMLLFLVVPFLLFGAGVFATFAAIPPLRRFALSASLWCVALLPGVAVWGMLGLGLAVAKDRLGSQIHFPSSQFSFWQMLNARSTSVGLMALGLLLTLTVATGIAMVHQVVIQRLTFALFRIYACLVVAGIGSIPGWALGVLILGRNSYFGVALWLACFAALVVGGGILGFRYARMLRGEAPERFAWVTREEFEGTV